MEYVWSASNNTFFPKAFLSDYVSSGWVIDDAIDIEKEVYDEFSSQNPGKKRVVGQDGMPAWEDLPSPSNSELLSIELKNLGDGYKSDIYDLNTAYLAAIVNDGPSEVTKQQVVRDQIAQRKAQYISDIATAREKYPT